MTSRTGSEPPVRVIGEVRTGLLRHGRALSQDEAVAALARLVPGEIVRRAERPSVFALSGATLTGVDCALPSRDGRRVRAVGTVASRAAILGGRVLQGSSYARVVPAPRGDRVPQWAYYLGRPGTVEAIGRLRWDDVADGFARDGHGSLGIGLGPMSEEVMDRVQRSPLLDGKRPFPAARTSLRWAFAAEDESADTKAARFVVVNGRERTLRISGGGHRLSSVIGLCEDLALHDWLLGTLLVQVEKAQLGGGPVGRMMERIRPVVDHLLHLWMPGARIDQALLPIWESLDRYPGFTRQWEITVSRIRDQMALSTLALLTAHADRADVDEPPSSRRPAVARQRTPGDPP